MKLEVLPLVNTSITQSAPNMKKKSIKFKGPRIWQQIDSSLKELPAIIFKKRYRNSIIESYKNHE